MMMMMIMVVVLLILVIMKVIIDLIAHLAENMSMMSLMDFSLTCQTMAEFHLLNLVGLGLNVDLNQKEKVKNINMIILEALHLLIGDLILVTLGIVNHL
ncbi:hypothetical protein REPUB_Repub02eG0201600 [Reevesia pubescens]